MKTFILSIFLLGFLLIITSPVVSSAESEYDFVMDHSVPGLRDLGFILVSPEDDMVCVVASNRTYIYELSSKSITLQSEFQDRYFKSGVWLGDEIILSSYPLVPFPPNPPPITVLSPYDLSIKAEYSIESGRLIKVAPSPDGRYLAGINKRDLWIFDIEDGFSLVHHTQDHSDIIQSIAWNIKGTSIASAGYDEIWVFDMIENVSRELSITNANSRELFWSLDDSTLMNIKASGSINIIDVASGVSTGSESISGRIDTADILFINNDMSIGEGYDLVILSLDTYEQIARFRDATDEIIQVTWIQDGSRIVSIADDGVLRIYIDRNHALYNDPPEIVILEPTEGQVVTKDFSAKGTITDDEGIMFSLYRLNELEWDVLVEPSDWQMTIHTSSLVPGKNTLTVKASDGDQESIASVDFIYEPEPGPNEPPEVNFTSPDNGSTVKTFFDVTGTSSDDVTVVSVWIRIEEGSWTRVQGTMNWTYHAFLPDDEGQWIDIYARSFDGELNSSMEHIKVFIESQVSPGNYPPSITLESPVDDAIVLFEIQCKGQTIDDGENVITYINIDSTGWTLLSEDWSWDVIIPLDLFDHSLLWVQFMADDGELVSDIVTVNVTRIFYEAPEITIASPEPGLLFLEELNISGTVTAGYWEIQRVEVRLNGGPWILTTGTRDWYYTFHPDPSEGGEFLIEARAFDDFTNSSIATTTAIYYVPMEIIIDHPPDGYIFNSTINVSGRVIGGYEDVNMVELCVNGMDWITVEGTRGWHLEYQPGDEDIGTFQLQARAVDDHFTSGTHGINVTYYRPMVVRITVPLSGEEFTEAIHISGTVLYGYGNIQRVQLRVNEGEWIDIGDTKDWYHVIQPKGLRKGENMIEVRALDDREMSQIEDIVVVYSPEDATIAEPDTALIIIVILTAVGAFVLFYVWRNHRRKQ